MVLLNEFLIIKEENMSTFKFANQFGFSPPQNFNQQQPGSTEDKFYWTGDINFQKLIDLIKSGNPIKISRHETLFKGQLIKIGGYGLDINKFESYLLGINSSIALSSFFNTKSRTPLIINKEEFYYNGYIINASSNSSKTINTSKVEFAASINIEEKYYRYRMLFPFNGKKGDSIFEKYGLIVETNSYHDFETLVSYLNLTIPDYFKNEINGKFQLELDNAKSDCNKIDEIYEFAPNFVIAKRNKIFLWDDLVSLSKCGIDREILFVGTDENIAVLNIITNFPNTYYLYNQFWKFPSVLNTLLYRIDKDYRIEFLKAVSLVFMEHWKAEDIENAAYFNLEPVDYYNQFDPEKLEMSIVSWCGFDSSKRTKNYEIGYTVYVYDDSYSPLSSDSQSKTLAWLDGIAPVKINAEDEDIYFPAFSVAYFTEEDAIEDRQVFINDYLLTGFLSAPSSVAKSAVVTAKSAQLARAYALRSYIAKRFKDAVKVLKQRLKNLRIKNEKLILPEQHLKDFTKTRNVFHKLSTIQRLWKQKITNKRLFLNNLKKLYFKYLNEYPNLQKGFNQAEFKTIIFKNGKKVDEVIEFSLSGKKDKLLTAFGNPPNLPPNTIDILDNYDDFLTFVEGAVDFAGQVRKYDSEIKYIYNFLKNHINKGDEFIIETQNIFTTCGSCRREFVMLEDYLSKLGKKVKITVYSDETIKGTARLKEKLKLK